MFRQLAAGVLAVAFASSACSQEAVTFPTAPSQRLPVEGQADAILTLPPNAKGPTPAVVLIHDYGGYAGPELYEFYGAALREAGIATLGVILFRPRTRQMQSQAPSYFLGHAYGALKFLAAQPGIDPGKIGIMGFSLGGVLSMYTASGPLSSEHLGGGPRFAAHAPLYPACWVHEANVRASQKLTLAGAYAGLTGAPIHILAGAKDQLDDPDTCQRFVEALPVEARKSVVLTVFPNATHNWDVGRSYRYFDRYACKGKGCDVDVEFDAETAKKGRQIVVEFFSAHLLRAVKQ